MKWSRGLASSVMILVLGAGVALAQAPADTKPATGSKPVAAPSAPVAGDKTDKKAVSKACSGKRGSLAVGWHGYSATCSVCGLSLSVMLSSIERAGMPDMF
jgi:hypothetical protein